MAEPTIAQRYAAFADDLRFETIPEFLIEKASLHILDTIGCAIAASRTDYASSMLAALTRLEGG